MLNTTMPQTVSQAHFQRRDKMKSILAARKPALLLGAIVTVGMAGNSASAASILVGFDTFNTGNHTVNATGFSATISGGAGSRNNSSTDGTYGTFGSGASTDTLNGVFTVRILQPSTIQSVILTMTNNSGTTYNLSAYHFDYTAKGSNNTPDTLDLSISGGIGTAAGPLTGLDVKPTTFSGTTGDYDDFSYDLTGLAIADGASITFTLTPVGGINNDAGFIDNFAIVGTPVPEPGSLAVGFLGLGALAMRRRRVSDCNAH